MSKNVSTRMTSNSSEIIRLLEMSPAQKKELGKRIDLTSSENVDYCFPNPTIFLTGREGLILNMCSYRWCSPFLWRSRGYQAALFTGDICLHSFLSPHTVSASRFKNNAGDSKRRAAIGQTEKGVCVSEWEGEWPSPLPRLWNRWNAPIYSTD